MKSSVFVISLSSNKSISGKVETYLLENGIKPTILEIKKCVQLSDIADYLILSKCISPIEKGYLRDEKKDQAAIISIQKAAINKIIEPLDNTAVYLVEDDFSPESFYIKKLFFQSRMPFFTFGFLDNTDSLSIIKGSLDIGFNSNLLSNLEKDEKSSHHTVFPDFNGHIAIEPPPDSIPVRYLFQFRSPLNIVKSIISSLDNFYSRSKHPPVLISTPVRPYNSYSISTRAFQLEQLLKKRAGTFSDSLELPMGTTVLTWSTKRYFALLSQGLRPVPMTKCMALSTITLKMRKLNRMILENPAPEKISTIKTYIKFQSINKIKIEDLMKKP